MTPKKKPRAQMLFPSMFSAASFFDVLEAPVDQASTTVEDVARPPVIAFYGFRGGAGRTLALAHVAALLARRGSGLHLAVIDLDLEAPGVHVPLQCDASALTDKQGVVPLLRAATSSPESESLPVAESLLASGIPTGNGRISVLPAGRIGRRYLAQMEELNVGLWHSFSPPQPMQRVLTELSKQLKLDGILVDCRTGFSSLSASMLFHIADSIVLFLPLSAQVWDGFELVLKALKVARERRDGRPSLLVVPSMVPAGEPGKQMLASFVDEIEARYGTTFPADATAPTDEDAEALEEPRTVLSGGLQYDVRVAISGTVDRFSEANYGGLAEAVADLLGAEFTPAPAEGLDVSGVLDELQKIDSPFAEDAPVETLVEHFVRPSDMSALVHPDTLLIIGAKGAGKTWMWRYLVHEQSDKQPASFVSGHAPNVAPEEAGPLQLTKSAIREIETTAQMSRRNTYGAFWRLYAVARLLHLDGIPEAVRAAARAKEEKRALDSLSRAQEAKGLQGALEDCLRLEKASTLAEAVLAAVDKHLRRKGGTCILCYDGLDTDFEGRNLVDSARRRQAFVGALLEMILESRSKVLNVKFKVFLREDIWAEVTLQNKSHFGAATVELRWQAEDLWRIALDQLSESYRYEALIQRIQPGVSNPWPVDNETLEALLTPLWGRTVEGRKGKGKARTARYVERRIRDAKGRVFPRTMLQILSSAATEQRRKAPTAGRVISFAALRGALEKASELRVQDLTKEYAYLQPYLEAMRGMNAIATREEIIEKIRGQMKRPKKGRGVSPGALHAGAGGWAKVVRHLEDVGVLGPYERERDTDRLAVAMLYRSGLSVKAAGLH